MTELLDWLGKHSPPVVFVLVVAAGLLFVLRLVVERTLTASFDRNAKVFEAAVQRRSAFEERVLLDRFITITSLVGRMERVATNLNRMRSGHPVPEGFFIRNELVPLTEVFEDIEINRLVLGEEFHRLLLAQAQTVLQICQAVAEPEAWQRLLDQHVQHRGDIRQAANSAFGIDNIKW